MSFKNLSAAFVVLVAVVAVPKSASATTIGFTCLTNNTLICGSYASDITGEVTVSGNLVTFTVTNGAGGGISEIYADVPSSWPIDALTGLVEDPPDVAFGFGGSPPNVPGGVNANPDFESNFMAQEDQAGNTGSANLGETVGMIFTLAAPTTQAQVDAWLLDGSLRFGLHIQQLLNGNSEAMISGPPVEVGEQCVGGTCTTVPEPTSMLLLGTGLLAAARAARRRKTS